MMAKASFMITNARLICPFTGLDDEGSMIVHDGRIERITLGSERPDGPSRRYDGRGLVIAPGLTELNAYCGEPGREYVGDLHTLANAGVRGGFTAIGVSPMTDPVSDTASAAIHVRRGSQKANAAILYPIGSVTKAAKGTQLTEMFELSDEGVVALSDGPYGLPSPGILRRAMEYAHAAGLPVLDAPLDEALAGDGVMHEGVVSTRLGLKGIPIAAEEVRVARGIALVRQTGIPLHVGPISSSIAVELIMDAKASGLPITCSVHASHLHFVDEDVATEWSTNLKVEPPFRALEDRRRLRAALQQGVIDIVSSGHRPQGLVDKEVPFSKARPGMIGLETCLGTVMSVVESGEIDLKIALKALTFGPSRLLGLGHQGLAVGTLADLTIFQPTTKRRIEVTELQSRAVNSPYLGAVLPGQVMMTVVQGDTSYVHSELEGER